MGARLFPVRRLAAVAFMATLAAPCLPLVGGPYLPHLGPIPLRFSAKPAPPTVAAALIAPADTSSTANPIAGSSDATHEAALATPTNAVATRFEVSTTDYTFTAPAVGMTPQMMAEYFQPVPGRTNAPAALFVPVSVSFTPPVPKTEVSSRATYKIR